MLQPLSPRASVHALQLRPDAAKYIKKKSACQWTCAVQNHVVRGSALNWKEERKAYRGWQSAGDGRLGVLPALLASASRARLMAPRLSCVPT